MKKLITLSILALASVAAFAKHTDSILPAGSRVYIDMGDSSGFYAAEFSKQHIAVAIASDPTNADYVLTGSAQSIGTHGSATAWTRFNVHQTNKVVNQGSASLVRVSDNATVWADDATGDPISVAKHITSDLKKVSK